MKFHTSHIQMVKINQHHIVKNAKIFIYQRLCYSMPQLGQKTP